MDHSAVQLSGNVERRAWTAPTNSVDALPSMGDGAGLPPPFPDAVIRSLAPPGVGLGDLGLAEQMHAGHLLFLMCPAAQTIRMARPRGRNHAGTRANDGAKPCCQRLFSPCTHTTQSPRWRWRGFFLPRHPRWVPSHRIALPRIGRALNVQYRERAHSAARGSFLSSQPDPAPQTTFLVRHSSRLPLSASRATYHKASPHRSLRRNGCPPCMLGPWSILIQCHPPTGGDGGGSLMCWFSWCAASGWFGTQYCEHCHPAQYQPGFLPWSCLTRSLVFLMG